MAAHDELYIYVGSCQWIEHNTPLTRGHNIRVQLRYDTIWALYEHSDVDDMLWYYKQITSGNMFTKHKVTCLISTEVWKRFRLFACLILAPDSLKELCKSGSAANTATKLVLIAIHTSTGFGRPYTMIWNTLLSFTTLQSWKWLFMVATITRKHAETFILNKTQIMLK